MPNRQCRDEAEYAKSVEAGITLIAASDYWGSNNSVPWGTVYGGFRYNYLPDSYLMPQYSPYVTAVGGTNLYLGAFGSYGSETGWNQSGGGPSNLFQQPSWQVGHAPGNGARDIPDIDLDASCSTPYSFYWKDSPYNYFCGTSAAAPTFAEIVADVDQAAGRSLGCLDPSLYAIATSDPAALHDVTFGGSVVQTGSSVATGDCAGVGWDFVTGLGSVDTSSHAADFVPRLTFATTATMSSATTISTSATTTMSTSSTQSTSSQTYTTPHQGTASSTLASTACPPTTTQSGAPEFPFQLVESTALKVVLTVSYLVVRRFVPSKAWSTIIFAVSNEPRLFTANVLNHTLMPKRTLF
ncbi:MAG: hypothetical protein JRN35_10735 [Nitrososphaerota archaeon]|nr:hypothetical protein [Nitrososphaerota archaeon]